MGVEPTESCLEGRCLTVWRRSQRWIRRESNPRPIKLSMRVYVCSVLLGSVEVVPTLTLASTRGAASRRCLHH